MLKVKANKMTAVSLSAVLGVTLLLAGCGNSVSSNQTSAGSGSAANTTQQQAQIVHVVASNWKWTLDKTAFVANEPIQFDVSSTQGTHGFSIDGTAISKPVSPGQSIKVTWTPPKPGTYTIRCNIYCGAGHAKMFTTFTVT